MADPVPPHSSAAIVDSEGKQTSELQQYIAGLERRIRELQAAVAALTPPPEEEPTP